jgi:DNA-binding transcriptional MerR regulator
MRKSKKYLSRNEAVEILGVHPQSVSNYAERGFLTTIHSRTNKYVRFHREEVEALKPQIRELSNREQAILEVRKAIDEDYRQLREQWIEQRKLLSQRNLCVSYTKELIENCYCFFACTQNSSPARTLLRILQGEEAEAVAKDLGFSVYKLAKVCKQALAAVSLIPKYEEMCNQNEELKAEIWSLTSSYNVLCERFNALAVMHKELVGKTEGI